MGGVGYPGNFELKVQNKEDVADHEFHCGGRHLPNTKKNSKNELFFTWKQRINQELYEKYHISLMQYRYDDIDNKSIEEHLFEMWKLEYDTLEVKNRLDRQLFTKKSKK